MRKLSFAIMGLAIAGLMTMVSCRKPNMNNVVPGASRVVTFNATTESNGGSKTTLDGLDVKWSEGDQIKVNNQTLTLATGAGTKNCTFTGEVSGTEFYAGYPVSAFSYTDASTMSISIPETMEYNAENPTEGLVRMVAHTTSDGDKVMLNFKNAVNVLKLPLNGDGSTASNLTSIVLKSISNLNGNIGVTFDGQNATFGYADGNNTTTITFGSGLQLTSGETKYVYILLPRISGGDLAIRFNCSNNKYMKKRITVTDDFDNVNNIFGPTEVLTVNATTSTPTSNLSMTTDPVCDNCVHRGASGSAKLSVWGVQTPQECEYGFVYAKKSVNSTPTIGGNGCSKIVCGIGDVTTTAVTFNADLDLEPGVVYCFRAYAIGENGSKYYSTARDIDAPKAVGWNNGSSPKKFTVNNSPLTKVYFSQGNLQYYCSTSAPVWRFAEHQFDVIDLSNESHTTTDYGENTGKWIELFGWGTSGQNHGARCYQPWEIYSTFAWYYAYGDPTKNLYDGGDNAGKADWGYNDISNDGSLGANAWRTLKKDEWVYLFTGRTNADNLYGKGKVGCMNGVIILPDDWNWSNSLLSGFPTFTPGNSEWTNVYSYTQWSVMESLGAVFLPATGNRYYNNVSQNGISGLYWSSTKLGNDSWISSDAFILKFSKSYFDAEERFNRDKGLSVRLVRNVTSK